MINKKISIFIIVFAVFYNVSFAQFEVGVVIPLGVGITFPRLSIDYRDTLPLNKPISINGGMNIDLGVMLQVGYNFPLTNAGFIESIGVFLDTGYYAYTYDTKQKLNIGMESISYSELIGFHSINVGILPKINLKYYSIGLGGGIRVPVTGEADIYDQYSSIVKLPEEETIKYGHSELNDMFKYLFAPYIKLTFEGKLNLSKRFAFSIGSFFSYDFGMEYKADKLNEDSEYIPGLPYIEKYKCSSFSVGFLVGLYFK